MPRKKSTNPAEVTKRIVAAANTTKNMGMGTPAQRRNRSAMDMRAMAMDSFRNMPARMGMDTPSLAEGTEYVMNRVTNNYWLMITLFRNHWISRRMVEIPAQDMCKAWPILNCEIDPGEISQFDRMIDRTLVPQKIQEAIVWARLFGGAGALMVIDGHEDILDQPIDFDEINPGTFKGLITFDRWSGISPDTTVLADDLNMPADYNLPKYYKIKGNQDSGEFAVHHSRILRFTGPEVPYPEKSAQMLWGISVLEPAFEEIRKRDNASWSILQLLFRAQILAQVNPELAQLLSGLGASQLAAQKYETTLRAQNELLSNNSMLVLGKDGSLQSHQYTFGGVAEVLNAFEVAVAGASDGIPFARLFGKSVSGLNQTNEGDEKMWEENVARKQHGEMKPQLDKMYPVLCMSQFGMIPDDLDYKFPSIRVLTEREKADLAKDGGESILALYNAGIISQKTTLMEIKQLSAITGIGTNITDEDIENADDKPQDPLELEMAMAKAGSETFEEDGKEGVVATPGKTGNNSAGPSPSKKAEADKQVQKSVKKDAKKDKKKNKKKQAKANDSLVTKMWNYIIGKEETNGTVSTSNALGKSVPESNTEVN